MNGEGTLVWKFKNLEQDRINEISFKFFLASAASVLALGGNYRFY